MLLLTSVYCIQYLTYTVSSLSCKDCSETTFYSFITAINYQGRDKYKSVCISNQSGESHITNRAF